MTAASIAVIISVGAVLVEQGRRDLGRARKATELETTAASILSAFPSGTGELPALRTAVKIADELRSLTPRASRPDEYPTVSPILVLQTVLNRIHEKVDFDTHGHDVSVADISPDGTRVAIVEGDGFIGGKFTLVLWSTGGSIITRWNGQGGANDIRFIDGGQRVAISPQIDQPGIVYDLTGNPVTGAQQEIRRGMDGAGARTHQFPDGTVVEYSPSKVSVTDGLGKLGKSWSVSGYNSAFAPTKSIFATADEDNVSVWSVSGEQQARFAHPGGRITSLTFSPASDLIVVAAANGSISVWDTTGRHLMDLNGHRARVSAVRFDSSGRQLLTVALDDSVRLWTLQDSCGQRINGGSAGVLDVAFRADGSLLTLNNSGVVRVWTREGEERSSVQLPNAVAQSSQPVPSTRSMNGGLSLDGTWAASSDGQTGPTVLWETTGPKPIEVHRVPSGALHVELDAAHGIACAVPAGGGATIQSSTGTAAVYPPGGWLYSCGFSPDGAVVATVGAESTVRIWRLNGSPVSQFHTDQLQTLDVDFSPDGSMLAVAGGDGTIRFSKRDGTEVARCSGHIGRILGVRFSPDGSRLASIGMDNTVRVWDVTGRQLAQFEVTSESVIHEMSGGDAGHRGIAFSPHGDRLAVGAMQGTVHVWPIESVTQLVERGQRWLALSARAHNGR
jgi:WD40 repeat protein